MALDRNIARYDRPPAPRSVGVRFDFPAAKARHVRAAETPFNLVLEARP